ncbi:UNVERIFIED_CONTAM: TATA-box binding protein [Acetivibrio alkalicellulosi]
MKKVIVKYSYLSILLIILFTIGYIRLYYIGEPSLTVLKKAFASSSAQHLSSDIYIWSRPGNGYDNFNHLVTTADAIASNVGLDLSNEYSKTFINNDSIDKLEIYGVTNNGKIFDITALVNKKNENHKEAFMSVNISTHLEDLELVDTIEGVRRSFKENNLNPIVNTCITGYYDGKLDYEDLNNVSKRIFKNSRAGKIDGITDRNLISVSAYSPAINDSININGKKVNMNLAIRYNSHENKTYIWLASPVITTEY